MNTIKIKFFTTAGISITNTIPIFGLNSALRVIEKMAGISPTIMNKQENGAIKMFI